MKLIVMAVFDSGAQAYGRPIFVPSVGLAERSFADEVNRGEQGNAMSQHAADFALYELGTFVLSAEGQHWEGVQSDSSA